jgi:hypothetical protein
MYTEYRSDALKPTIQRFNFAESREFEESEEDSLNEGRIEREAS